MRIALLVIVIFSFFPASAQQIVQDSSGREVLLFSDGSWIYKDQLSALIYARPANPDLPGDTIINHPGFSFSYNEQHEQANWVGYEYKSDREKVAKRTDRFMPDHLIASGSSTSSDYAHSGYDRGHLAPAADMSWSLDAMTASFYYSNMSPQLPSFNRGIWKKLEEKVRSFGDDCESIYVITGPLLTPGLPTIGTNEVSVPTHFFKVLLDYREPDVKMIAFLIPHKNLKGDLKQFAVTVDHVETLTGIDFFYVLPDLQEFWLEQQLCLECWGLD